MWCDKEEEVDLSEYENFHDAYREMGRFLDDADSRKRIHSSLGYLTAVEFEAEWQGRQGTPPGGVIEATPNLCPDNGAQ
ncbi:MAG: hypothetical protein HY321_19220 [Armatimonadetes bacterium]|nr:hypothetical protein [Armatimonadota bacterium]